MFGIYNGPTETLTTDEKHEVFRWTRIDCKILFSATRHGNALNCHIFSDQNGLRLVKKAIEEFEMFTFEYYPWSEMITVKTKRHSFKKILEDLGYKKIYENGQHTFYVKVRSWVM